METVLSSSRSRALLAAAGPLLAGAILGLRSGPRAMLIMAAALPAIAFGAAALTTPALYAGSAVLGQQPSLRAVATAVGRCLLAFGLALLGLSPLALLVAATVTSPEGASGRVVFLLVVAGAVALRRLCGEMPLGQRKLASVTLLAGWVLVTAVIGGRLFLQALASGAVRVP
jgi:hypothetical protein